MRDYGSAVTTHLTARGGLHVEHLVWITAANRGTSAPETVGISTHDDTYTYTVDGGSRVYIGGGGALEIEPIRATIGVAVQSHEITLSPLAPEVEEVLLTHDPRLAPIEVHRVFFDPDTGDQIGDPFRILLGWINGVSIETPPIGGEASARLDIVTAARSLTIPLYLLRSNEAQLAVHSGDVFRQYSVIADKVSVYWGRKRK